jgi:membrane protein
MIQSIQKQVNLQVERVLTFFKTDLWKEFPEDLNPIKRVWLNLLRVVYVMIREFAAGQLSLRAMSLVFTTLLSLVPLIAVAFSVLKAFGVHNQMEPVLLSMLEPLGARGPEITSNIIGFVQNVKVGVLGSVGLAMLFYTIIALVQKVESAFNFVWRVKRARSMMRRFTDYLSVVIIGPVLVFAALGLAATVLNHSVITRMSEIEPFGTLLIIATKMLPYIMITLAFTFFYKFIPNTRVKMAPALIGAAVAGGLWITIGSLFASFVASSSNYTAIYSSFAILFFFMIWLYLAWFIMLTGAQVAFYMQHPKLVKLGGKPMTLSPRMRESEGLWLMTLITRRFCQKLPPYTVQELEELSGLTNNAIQEILYQMEQRGLVIEAAGESTAYVPGQDVSQILVTTVLHCLRTAEENDTFTIKNLKDPVVNNLLDTISTAQADVLGDLSLKELAMGDWKAHE